MGELQCMEAKKHAASKGKGCRCFLITVLTLGLVCLCVVSAGLIYKYKYGKLPSFLKSRVGTRRLTNVAYPSVTDARATAMRCLLAEGKRITAEDVLSWYPQYEELN